MRLIANILLIASLVAGLFGAATAYLPPLSLPDDQLVGATLSAPAGARAGSDGVLHPIAATGTRLTPELIAALRSAGVPRVRVKEFSTHRWTGSSLFLASCFGLAVGALLGRAERKIALTMSESKNLDRGVTPEIVLTTIRRAVDDLRAELTQIPGESLRQQHALDVLTVVQENLVPEFVALRPWLTVRIGLAGYARLMDRFAAGERQINRAWSAAADGFEAELAACLDCAAELLAEAAARLEKKAPPSEAS